MASHTSNSSIDAPIVTECTYSRGILSWAGNTIKDEDLITVIEGGSGYQVLSLKGEIELQNTPASILPKEFLDQWLYGGLPSFLEGDVYVLVSVRSGTGLAMKFLEVLLPVLEAIGVPEARRIVMPTKNAESVKEFVKGTLLPAANEGTEQTVLMLSGDGGIVDSINCLADRSKYVLPLVISKLTKKGHMRNRSCPSSRSEQAMRSFTLSTNPLPSHQSMSKHCEPFFEELQNHFPSSKLDSLPARDS